VINDATCTEGSSPNGRFLTDRQKVTTTMDTPTARTNHVRTGNIAQPEQRDSSQQTASQSSQRPTGQAPKIHSVTVIGAGAMGRGIAAANVAHGIPVVLSDTSQEMLSAGVDCVLNEVAAGADENLIHGSTSDAELAASGLVIEAIVERLKAKQRLFARLEPMLKDSAVLASNTSSLSITQVAAALNDPSRLCGMHFCHPVSERPLVEIVRGRQTSDETVAAAVQHTKAIGKLPIVVKDGPGFLVNRLLTLYLNEAIELVLDGMSVESVEQAATSFGMPMGPFSHLDAIGIDVAIRVGANLQAAFPDRVVASDLPVALFELNRLGHKTAAGFFTYEEEDVDRKLDSEVEQMIHQRRRGNTKLTHDETINRLLLPMIVEASRVLEEGIVETPRDVDLALINGIAFPRSTGGLLAWADKSKRTGTIPEWLKPYESLGKRYHPTALLREMASKGWGFYR